jgi:alpha-galactosidase
VRLNKRNFRYIGKYRFEEQDARQWAKWGVDYLKYDWRIETSSAERMRNALDKVNRDIIYSISNSAPLNRGTDWVRLTNVFRSGPDIRDSWTSVYLSTFKLADWTKYGGPGHWIDPDMLVIGNVTTGSPMHPTRLTPDEQYSHVSIFSLLSAPMLIGCPLERLDPFTINLLNNHEVLDINQDPLGKPARLLGMDNGVQIWLKELKDGSYALGMFNMANYGEHPASYFRWGNEKEIHFKLDFEKFNLPGKWLIRDVWKQKDAGEFFRFFTTKIPHHGVKLIKLVKIKD